MSVWIETTFGQFVVDLFFEECPIACQNFLSLCKIKYYNNCLFYNIQKDFIIQSGDPTNTGLHGNSIHGILHKSNQNVPLEQQKIIPFQDEIIPSLKHNQFGLLCTANKVKHQNTSQFYITTTDRHLDYLDEKHTIFGQVAEGLEVIHKINQAITDDNGKPYQAIRILHTYILIDPFSSSEISKQVSTLIPPQSPPPQTDLNSLLLLTEDEERELQNRKLKTKEEIEEEERNRIAKSKAITLEALNDLPSADLKPPENVLFICRLNPVTQEDDLEIVFSRFGKVKKCDLIRDAKTGESMRYAFLEFEDKAACEQAYLKMENAIIDDRYIHVDFSQSVSKLWKKFAQIGKRGNYSSNEWEDKKSNSHSHSKRDEESSSQKRRYEERGDYKKSHSSSHKSSFYDEDKRRRSEEDYHKRSRRDDYSRHDDRKSSRSHHHYSSSDSEEERNRSKHRRK